MLQEVQIQVISGSAACQDALGVFPYGYLKCLVFLVGKQFGKQCEQSMGHGFHYGSLEGSIQHRRCSAPLFPGLDLIPFLEQALLGATS
jgi:hypothetical protein